MAALLVSGPRQLDILSWTTRVALETIGRGGLGHSFDPLVDDRRCEFGSVVVNLLSVNSFRCTRGLAEAQSFPDHLLHVSVNGWALCLSYTACHCPSDSA